MTKYIRIIFVNDILKSEAWNIELSKFFPGFELNFQVFTTFWANSRHFPGLEKKMTKFQVFQVGFEPCDCNASAQVELYHKM